MTSPTPVRRNRAGVLLGTLLVALLAWLALGIVFADPATATPVPTPTPSAEAPSDPASPGPEGPAGPNDPNSVSIELNGLTDRDRS